LGFRPLTPVKTYTPELDPAVRDRLGDYAARFADDFPRAAPAARAGGYLRGPLPDGDRESVEPPSRRVALPPGLAGKDPEQARRPFVNQSPWDERAALRRYRATPARSVAGPGGAFPTDDAPFPKQGARSAGVQRQYRGARGKRADGQVAVSVHYGGQLCTSLMDGASWVEFAERRLPTYDEPHLNNPNDVHS
jgi:SRSO17 transposase